MTRFKVVVSDQVFPSVEVEKSLLATIGAELVVAEGTLERVLDAASDADAILNTYLPWDAESLNSLEKCRIIARYGIGVDNIDLDAASGRGIVVTNVPDYSVEEVATHALAMILSAIRRIPLADETVRSGGWNIEALRPIRRLSTLTVGIVGYGRIGRRLAEPLRAMGCEIVAYDPYLSPGDDLPPLLDLDSLLAASDIVSLHIPLTPETRGVIGEAAISGMRRGAILVNTSRGPLVDFEALVSALRSGQLGGAGLDVFETEPFDYQRLEGVPNLIVSPHMAYYSEQAIEESQLKATTQVIKVLTGEQPDYKVN